jgi:hypothetical protein
MTTAAAPTVARLTPRPKPPPPPPPPPKVTVTHTYTPDGARVTVAIFSGAVKYVLHNGSEDPGSAISGVTAGPSVSGAEQRVLLGAFNGGFKLSASAGGYMQEGHVAARLLSGYASFVINRNGAARVTIWPSGSSGAYSVRQNLQPLVEHGRPTSAASDWTIWGATLGGGSRVARSAVGEAANGDIVYVASMSAVPIDLARAMTRYGVQTGMELDINPEWVQLDVASHPGGSLYAAIPGQVRPADQYLSGWTRDFITVLAR